MNDAAPRPEDRPGDPRPVLAASVGSIAFVVTERNLPLRWVDDVWRTIDGVLTDELSPRTHSSEP